MQILHEFLYAAFWIYLLIIIVAPSEFFTVQEVILNNFGTFLTPQEAYDKQVQEGVLLEEYEALAAEEGTCSNCDEPIWKLVGLGMCFSCTTGEADASEDFELIKTSG